MVDIYSTKILIRYREFYYIYFITSIISSPLCFISLQWGYISGKESNTQIEVILPITLQEKHLAEVLTYIDNPAIVNGTLTVISGSSNLNGFSYWDSTPTGKEINNIRYISIGK